jgi:hypothetical protein
MTFNPNRYEHSYGVGLLDDLHNLFPEILYDRQLFGSSSLVSLIRERVHSLYEEEFVRNRSQYRLYQQERRHREAGIPTQHRRIRTPPPRRTVPIQSSPQIRRFSMNFMSPEFDTTTLLMRTLLGMDTGTPATMEPVVVAPSAEQIRNATIVTSMVPSDAVCSICQDDDNTESWRIIRHCQHRFHSRCIDEWFRQNVHCPVCRFDIRDHEEIDAA